MVGSPGSPGSIVLLAKRQNVPVGPTAFGQLYFDAALAIEHDYIAPYRMKLEAVSWRIFQAPVGGLITFIPGYDAGGDGGSADPGSAFHVSPGVAAAADMRGQGRPASQLVLNQGDQFSARYSADAAWNAATADVYAYFHFVRV